MSGPGAVQLAIVCASPLHAQGLEAALAPVHAVRSVHDAAALAAGPADAVVAPVATAAEGLALQRVLPPGLPLVLLGTALRAMPGARPLALLAPGASTERLRAAVLAVGAGLQVRDPAFAAGAQDADAGETEPLTARELEVLELMAKGLSNRDIGRALGISAHTAKFHVGQVLAKTGSATRAEAVHAGLRQGLIGL